MWYGRILILIELLWAIARVEAQNFCESAHEPCSGNEVSLAIQPKLNVSEATYKTGVFRSFDYKTSRARLLSSHFNARLSYRPPGGLLHQNRIALAVLARPEEKSKKSPETAGKTLGLLVAGALGTWAGGYPLWSYLEEHASDRQVKGDAGYSPTANAGLILGSIMGNSIAVYLVGSSGDTKGSYLATVLGTTLASVPIALFGLDEPYLPYFALTYGAVLQSLGSMIGFNASSRPRASAETGTGLIDFRDGRASIAVPELSLQSTSCGGTAIVQYKLCVIRIRG